VRLSSNSLVGADVPAAITEAHMKPLAEDNPAVGRAQFAELGAGTRSKGFGRIIRRPQP
jgi:hypothetical protein